MAKTGLTFKIDAKEVEKIIKNTVDYTDGFLEEFKLQESQIMSDVMNAVVDIFYDDLDQKARSNPSAFHHIYEWYQAGDPSSRLVELDAKLKGKVATLSAYFLESTTLPENNPGETREPFSWKAEIMEYGRGVVIEPKYADVLQFTIGKNEIFTKGPIFVPNPGGNDVQGSFTAFFNQFFSPKYFVNKVLNSDLKFQQYFSNPTTYEKNYRRSVSAGGSRSAGKAAAKEWVLKAGYSMRITPSGRTQFKNSKGQVVSKDKATKKI